MGDDALKAAQAPCPPETTPPYYTLQEAAQLIGVPVAELQHAAQEGRLPFTHQFGRKLFSPDDVAAYMARHNHGKP